MSRTVDCIECGQRFSRGTSGRLACGFCWPADGKVDWASIPQEVSRAHWLRSRTHELQEAETSGAYIEDGEQDE